MTDFSKRLKNMKRSKERTFKIGKKSIHDIIHNTPHLSFSEKVNYIRHHYTYYEGNYDLFHDDNGNPNYLKSVLNHKIIAVVKGILDPSCLTEINKHILKLRNEKLSYSKTVDTVMALNNQKTIAPEITVPQWRKDIETTQESAKKYIYVIEAYLNETQDLSEEERQTISYKEIKEKALNWIAVNDNSDAARALGLDLEKMLTKNGVYVLAEQRRAEKLMREYAKDLGYIVNDNAEDVCIND